MFTYNIFIYQLEPETLIFKGLPALPIHLRVENGNMAYLASGFKPLAGFKSQSQNQDRSLFFPIP